jgi:hypothetical protein
LNEELIKNFKNLVSIESPTIITRGNVDIFGSKIQKIIFKILIYLKILENIDYNHLKNCFNYYSFDVKIKKYLNEVGTLFNKDVFEVVKEYVSYHNIPRYALYKNVGDIHQSILELVKRIIYEDVTKINSNYSGIQFEKLVEGKKVENQKQACNFDCFYYCWKIGLERDIEWLKNKNE